MNLTEAYDAGRLAGMVLMGEVVGFAAPPEFRGSARGKKGTKKKACKKGDVCGGTCIRSGLTCRASSPSPGAIASAKGLKKVAARQGAARAGDRKANPPATPAVRDPRKDPRPGDVTKFSAKDIEFDPKRFQYKLVQTNAETGAVGSLAGIRRWDDNLAGVVSVWKDPDDGKTYVVNGHNRLDLARKLGVDEVAVRLLDAKDATEARAIGALTNIAEGRGTPLDAAKFFRDSGISREDLVARGIPMKERIATEGLAIANLEGALFRRVIDGTMPMGRAATIGGAGLSHEEQRALVKMLEQREKRSRPITNETIAELVDTVKASSRGVEETATLFGMESIGRSYALEKATVQAAIKKRLSRERKLFGTVAKNTAAEELARAGNRIDVGASAEMSNRAARVLGVFDQLKNSTGTINDRLNAAAERIANGENARTVMAQTYKGIVDVMPDILAGKVL